MDGESGMIASSLPPPLPAVTRWRRWAACAGVIVVGIAGIAYLAAFDPTQAVMPKCAFYEMTGWHCPGCGTGRAIHALLHGELRRAVGLNPLLAMAMPVIGWVLLRAGPKWMNDAQAHPIGSGLRARTIWMIGGIIVGYWIARNLPWWPFVLLAP